mgnify:CR=1 FL=1
MKLITEQFEDVQYITEASDSGEKKVFIEGVFMQGDKKNRNGRVYPMPILQNAVDKYVAEQVTKGRAVGELNHPDGPTVNLDKVSHRITELRTEGNNVVGKALILNTPMGQIVKGLVEGGCQLGVSSRGMGTLERRNGAMYVKDDFQLSTVDIVQDPSAPEAFVNGIMEGVEWVYDVASSSWTMANTFDEIEEEVRATAKHSTRELEEQASRIFEKFIKSLSK